MSPEQGKVTFRAVAALGLAMRFGKSRIVSKGKRRISVFVQDDRSNVGSDDVVQCADDDGDDAASATDCWQVSLCLVAQRDTRAVRSWHGVSVRRVLMR